MTEPMFDAGSLMAQVRRKADLSQRELARRAGVSQASVAALESGSRSVRLDVFASQCAADEPGTSFDESDAATVTGHALDRQALLLAHGYLCGTVAAGRLIGPPRKGPMGSTAASGGAPVSSTATAAPSAKIRLNTAFDATRPSGPR